MVNWTKEDNLAASSQGWNLFDADGELQLQREDELEIFASDEDAAAFVKQQASCGELIARKAITYLVKTGSGDVAKFSLT